PLFCGCDATGLKTEKNSSASSISREGTPALSNARTSSKVGSRLRSRLSLDMTTSGSAANCVKKSSAVISTGTILNSASASRLAAETCVHTKNDFGSDLPEPLVLLWRRAKYCQNNCSSNSDPTKSVGCVETSRTK